MDLVRAMVCLVSGALAIPAAADPPCSTDRWEPFIARAAVRSSVEPEWIRAIMRAESAGCEFMNGQPTTSSAGAMGLMQLMPLTWEQQRQRQSLGSNPHDPHDNILAAAGYLRELLDRYGTSGFIAAYHAGPGRYDAFLAEGRALPASTLKYVARVRRYLAEPNDRIITRPVTKPSSNRSLFVTLRNESNDSASTEEPPRDVQSNGRHDEGS